MQRHFRIVGTVACRCVFRRLRLVEAARRGPLDGHVFGMGRAVSCPLAVSARHQATTPEKRFHCSVCKKAFRLEMAAKLHLQQVHGGEGAVEAGAGPGQPEEQAAQTPIGVFRNAPPQAPTVVTPVQADLNDRPARREKPAPKPLHQAEREVPNLAMEKMLFVWDDIGVKRMGSQFVHSSMVMRVFAARPSDSVEPLYGVINPEGENPFEGGDATPTDSSGTLREADANHAYPLRVKDAFAMASEDSFGPYRPAKCPNPFFMKVAREVSRNTARADVTEQRTAPVTPFGQLPLFGQLPSQPPTPETPEAATAAAEGSGTLVSSPFAAGVDGSPFAGTAATPFADVGYSPFVAAAPAAATTTTTETMKTATLTTSPPIASAAAAAAAEAAKGLAGAAAATTAAPSPFLSTAASPFAAAASPFAASPFTVADGGVPGGDFAGVGASFTAATYAAAVPAAAAATVPSTYKCAICERSFSTHYGLRMHSQAKHSLEIPKEADEARHRSVPDLPAYIPSPVDLSMTSPFGSSVPSPAWTEVELTPYAQSISNITVAGRIVDADTSQDGSVVLSVFVRGTPPVSEEMITVRCSAEAMASVGSPFKRGECVFACGNLRLLPVVDETTKKTFASPVVHVTTPSGVVARLNAC